MLIHFDSDEDCDIVEFRPDDIGQITVTITTPFGTTEHDAESATVRLSFQDVETLYDHLARIESSNRRRTK